MFLFFEVYVGQWLTQVIFYSVLDSEYHLISFKTWICLLNICFLFCDGVCSTPPNVLLMFLFNSFCLGISTKFWFKISKELCEMSQPKKSIMYYVLGSFCQNVEVVSWCLHIYIYIHNIQIESCIKEILEMFMKNGRQQKKLLKEQSLLQQM